MTQGTHWLRSALLALLALALLSGGSLAAGDLFDDDYVDCPHRTRMRDGEIADLTVARDAEEADEVNVAWVATDPAPGAWDPTPTARASSSSWTTRTANPSPRPCPWGRARPPSMGSTPGPK